MKPSRLESSSDDPKVVSPFEQSVVTVSPAKSSWSYLAVAITLLIVAFAIAGGIFSVKYLKDPYRTLEEFPVGKYFENYQTLAGSKFKADFRVEADLGWKDGAGRLMLFSMEEDPRPVAVLIPPAVSSGIYFTKGQTYLTAVEVKEGGLIYADSCQKN